MINERIKEIRKMRGLTQTEFAKQIGTTPSAISQIENGKRNPSYETLTKIIETFKLDPRWFFPEENQTDKRGDKKEPPKTIK